MGGPQCPSRAEQRLRLLDFVVLGSESPTQHLTLWSVQHE